MNLFPARLAQRERRGPSSVVQGLLPVCPPLILPQALQTSASAWAVTSSQSRGLAAPLGAGLRAALRRWRALHPAWPLPVSPSCLTLLELARIAVPRSHVFCGVFCLLFVCRRPFVSAGVGGSFIHCHVSEPRVAGSLEPLDTSLLNSGLAPPETVKGAFSCGEPPCDTGDGSIGFIRILKNECFLLDRGWRRVLTVGYDSLFCHL